MRSKSRTSTSDGSSRIQCPDRAYLDAGCHPLGIVAGGDCRSGVSPPARIRRPASLARGSPHRPFSSEFLLDQFPGKRNRDRRHYMCQCRSFLSAEATRETPSLKVQLNSFDEVGASALNILSLRCDAQLGAASDIKTIFFGDERGESVIHNQMLTEAKTVKQESVTIHESRITRNHGRRNN